MRITGGLLAGRLIEVPTGIIRPAMDRMRESIFAVLGDLSGASFLDIFSGSGSIALEAASRGAKRVVAVEADPPKRSTLLKNIAISPVPIRCHFIKAELFVKRAKEPFSYIFLDPPFPYAFKQDLLSRIAASPLVQEGTKILIHHPDKEELKAPNPTWQLSDQRKYGRAMVSFFTVVNEA